MAKDLNKVMITGRLGADPEMRFTADGTAVTTFRVASGRSWRSTDGEQRDEAEWFRVVAWNKLAEICNQYLVKGARVYIEGRLQTRKWQDKEGQDRYTTEVIAGDMIMLSSRNQHAEAPSDEPPPPEPPATASRTPKPAAAPATAPTRTPVAAGAGQPRRNVPQALDGDEDLPF